MRITDDDVRVKILILAVLALSAGYTTQNCHSVDHDETESTPPLLHLTVRGTNVFKSSKHPRPLHAKPSTGCTCTVTVQRFLLAVHRLTCFLCRLLLVVILNKGGVCIDADYGIQCSCCIRAHHDLVVVVCPSRCMACAAWKRPTPCTGVCARGTRTLPRSSAACLTCPAANTSPANSTAATTPYVPPPTHTHTHLLCFSVSKNSNESAKLVHE